MAPLSRIFSLLMILCFLPKLIGKILLLLEKFWILSVSSLGKKLVVKNLVPIFPPMSIFPIKHKGAQQDFGFILDRMKSKMAGWKLNLLFLVGRIVLTQSVTSTIPSYVMQYTALPLKILQGIDKLNRNFIWGTSETRKKVHLIGWNKVTKAKEESGLGIHAAKPKNTALLAKLNWRFHTKKSSLWVRVLSKKYRGQRGRTRSLASIPTNSPA